MHRDRLWRIVRTFPDHTVRIDEGMGRSAYLCPSAACLSAAQKKNRLSRTLKVSVPSEIFRELETRLEKK